jgi:UDP-glucose 4-epimerase
MRILVTGSEGSLMQAVIPLLIANGHYVIGIDKHVPHSDNPPYEFHELDLLNETKRMFPHIGMVIHAAATIFGIGGFNAFCGDIISNDLAMTRNMLNCAVKSGAKKFVFVSSSMVYERCPSPEGGVTEDMIDSPDYPVPFTDYGLSKFTGERMVKAFHRQYDLPYTIWRPFNIITPHEMARGEPGISHVFADYFNAVLVKRKLKVPMIMPGTQTRCFTWIDDVAHVIAKYSWMHDGTFNIGSTEEVMMIELLARIIALSGRNMADYEIDPLPEIVGDVMRRKPNIDKLTAATGWVPKVDLNESIRRCIKVYAERGYN